MSRRHFRELVRVLFHLSEGYTKVVVEITEGVGLADGGCWWDIPTKVIPPHLRCIGSRFYLVGESVSPDASDTVDDYRLARQALTVEEIDQGERVVDTPETSEIVEAALKQFLAESSSDQLWLRQLAADLHAMPLCCSWFRCIAIRASGEIISFDIESRGGVQPPGEIRIVNDQLTRNMALNEGAKNYPALQKLVPKRPPDAVDCSYCGGKGVLPAPAKESWMCVCGGLGWLPPHTKPGDYKF